jgi:hypothetical protein
MKIYSKVNGELLHMVNRLADITHVRNDISPDTEFLQVSAFRMAEGKTFRAHQHLPLERKTTITQESWIVIKGRVMAKLYDTDGTLLASPVLGVGDCSITFKGGHNYLCMEDDSVVYEYKTGPYMGQARDKTFIE